MDVSMLPRIGACLNARQLSLGRRGTQQTQAQAKRTLVHRLLDCGQVDMLPLVAHLHVTSSKLSAGQPHKREYASVWLSRHETGNGPCKEGH